MKKSNRYSSTTKLKASTTSSKINNLEDKLFSKIHKIQLETLQPTPLTVGGTNYEDLDIKLLNSTPDALTDLIYRAKGITVENQDKIEKAKKMFRVSKKEAAGTFLTGTGLYAVQPQPQPQPEFEQQPNIDPQQLLKTISRKGEYDDLAQLRRMIRITDENLGGYSRQVHQIKKEVMNAANQFKSPMNFDLTYKLNRLNQQPKKAKSVVRIKNTYNN